MKISTFARSLGTALFHLTASTVGVAVSSAIIFYSLKPILAPFVPQASLRRDAALTAPLFPFQSFVALVAGFALAMKHRELGRKWHALLVWIIPTVWLMAWLLTWNGESGAETRWQYFFWSHSFDSKKTQFLTTLPCLTSAAYCLGNYLGWRGFRSRRTPSIT